MQGASVDFCRLWWPPPERPTKGVASSIIGVAVVDRDLTLYRLAQLLLQCIKRGVVVADARRHLVLSVPFDAAAHKIVDVEGVLLCTLG